MSRDDQQTQLYISHVTKSSTRSSPTRRYPLLKHTFLINLQNMSTHFTPESITQTLSAFDQLVRLTVVDGNIERINEKEDQIVSVRTF